MEEGQPGFALLGLLPPLNEQDPRSAIKWQSEQKGIRMGTKTAEAEQDGELRHPEISLERLIGYLFDQPWQHACEIIPGYMPPHPTETTQPRCVVRFSCPEWKKPSFLRYSRGPKQGFGWDIYGDDLHNPELAILAIHQAPAPRNTSPIEFSLSLDVQEAQA